MHMSLPACQATQAGHVDVLRCLSKHATDDEYLDMSDSAK
jgi:hypothetical protein